MQRYKSEYGQLMPSQLMFLGQIEQTKGSEVTVDTYTSRYEYNPVDNDIFDLKFNLWGTNTQSINRNYSETMINPFFTGTPEEENYVRYGTHLSNHTQMLGRKIALRYGVAYTQEEVSSKKIKSKTSTTSTDTISGRNGWRKEYSAFLNAQAKPFSPITINVGIRYTKYQSQDKRDFVEENASVCEHGNSGACAPPADKSSFSDFAPLASIQYEPWKGIQVYGRYAQAVRMPSLFETTSGFSTKPSSIVKLKPEHAYNKEIGLNILQSNLLFDKDKLSFKMAVFNNITKDYLTRTLPNAWEKDPSVTYFVTRNIDSVELHGQELYMQYDANFAYARLGVTRYTHIEVCHYGSYRRQRCNNYGVANSYFNNMIPPNTNTTATLGVRLFGESLEFGVRGTFMGVRNSEPEYNNDTKNGFLSIVPWHRYEIYDFFTSYRLKKDFSIDLNVDNFTDQYYLDALSLGTVPAPGRTLRVALTAKF